MEFYYIGYRIYDLPSVWNYEDLVFLVHYSGSNGTYHIPHLLMLQLVPEDGGHSDDDYE